MILYIDNNYMETLMRFANDFTNARYIIRAYSKGTVRINDTDYHHSVILSQDQLISPWPIASLNQLQATDFQNLVALSPELVIIGVGDTFTFVKPQLLQPLYDKQIGVEIMTTDAACRTYNLLVGEGRKIVACLIINALSND